MRHRGLNEADPRNRGIIEHFRPPEVTADYARARFTQSMSRRTPAEIEAKVAKLMADLASKPVRPPPPLSQSVDQAPHPYFGLGAHPDIVSRLWALEDALPRPCRRLVWGFPALVHPRTGVIFALAFGTIGVVVRLPPDLRGQCPDTRRMGHDIAPAGEAWRFLRYANEEALCRAAFDAAGEAFKPRSAGEP
jgi:hypothetical protein